MSSGNLGREEITKIRLQCLREALKPLVRFCFSGSITLRDFTDSLKVVFVEVAAEQLGKEGKKANVSRISLMSGVHRKDVTRIFREDDTGIKESQSLVSRVTQFWEQSEEFTTKNGKPRILTVEGDDAEFKSLVWAVDRHMNPGAVQFEMERMGVIEHSPRGIKLKENVIRFQKDPARGYNLLARDLQSLLRAVEENIFDTRERKNLHIRTSYDNIFQNDLPKIETWLSEQGAKFHQRCRNFLAKYDKDVSPNDKKEGGGRVSVTAFSHTIPLPEDEPLPKN